MFIGHVVPFKGSGVEWLIEQLKRDLHKLGYYGVVTVKGDQERAFQDVLHQLAESRGESRTLVEGAPKGDSKGNGHAERAVRSAEEMIRLQVMTFEVRAGLKISPTSSSRGWWSTASIY